MLEQLEKDFPNDLRVVYRYYPLIGTPDRPFHDKAALSAQAAMAAAQQGKFWEMHDLLFQKQSDWASLTVSQFQDWLQTQAKSLGLDQTKFNQDLNSTTNVQAAQKAWDDYSNMGIPGTPFLVVNSQVWPSNMAMDYESVASIIKLTLLEKREYTTCPPMTIDPLKQYTATLKTSKGDIVIQLYPDKAPLAVNSFIFLARQGWFNGVTFHRVLANYIAQSGDPSGSGFGGPGYAFKNEISPDLKFDKAGVVAMANSGPDTNGSQFFITYGPTPNLDGSYTIFGQVISGMDVVKNLTPRDPSQGGNLPAGDTINSVTITEK